MRQVSHAVLHPGGDCTRRIEILTWDWRRWRLAWHQLALGPPGGRLTVLVLGPLQVLRQDFPATAATGRRADGD